MQFNQNLKNQLKTAYDIRSENLTNENAFEIGIAFGIILKQNNYNSCLIGYDRRKNSKNLHDSLIFGLKKQGIEVKSIGENGTNVCQFACAELNMDSCISVTASHNPIEFHGIKLFIKNAPFSQESLVNLIDVAIQNSFKIEKYEYETVQIEENYIKKVLEKAPIKNKFKIAFDCLNGTGGKILELMKKNNILNENCTLLNANLDELFEKGAPDPINRTNELKNFVKENKLDFGILLDGDADRFLLIKDELIQGDRILAMISYLDAKNLKKVIFDMKSANKLKDFVSSFCNLEESIIGHSNIYKKMMEKDADVAAETSGHFMFKEFFNISDGIFASFKFISLLERSFENFGISFNELNQIIPSVFTKDLENIKIEDFEQKTEFLNKLQKKLELETEIINNEDGIKGKIGNAYYLIRASKTEPIIRISCEGENLEELNEILEKIKEIFIN